MRTTLLDLLSGARTVVADGAMGTLLFDAGLEPGACPELWNVEYPERVRAVHEAYIAAGAQVVLSNSFGGSCQRLGLHGLEARAAELNCAAADLACTAAAGAPQRVLVAGSVGPTGVLMEPYGELSEAAAIEAFSQQCAALVGGGVDVIWIETMSDLCEVRCAVEGVRRAAPQIPICATMSFDTHGRTMMGVSPEQAAGELASLGLAAFGANCGRGPDELVATIDVMRTAAPGACLIAKPNAGVPRIEGGRVLYDTSAAVVAGAASRLRDAGARVIGGCCGTTPALLRAMAAALS